MSKTTGLIIVACLVVFIIIRVNIALNYSSGPGSSEDYSPDLPIAYTGTLPCASCPGIDYELRLEEGQFTEFKRYIDRDPGHFTQTGSWEISGDRLTIEPEDVSDRKEFIITNERLRLLKMDGDQIDGDLADNYILERNTEFQSILNRHRELREDGVTFLASGNEPFWSFRILEGDTLVYLKPDFEMKSRSLEIIQKDSGREYRAEFGSDFGIEITTEREFCQDTMSGFKFTHVVTITEDGVTNRGCGRYL